MLFFEKYFRQKSISQNISNEVQDQNNFSWNHDPSGNMNIIFFNKGNLQVKYKVLFHDFFVSIIMFSYVYHSKQGNNANKGHGIWQETVESLHSIGFDLTSTDTWHTKSLEYQIPKNTIEVINSVIDAM